MKNNFLLRRLKNVGNIRDAINIFEQVLELDPQNVASQEHLKELRARLAAKVCQLFMLDICEYYTWPDFTLFLFCLSFRLLNRGVSCYSYGFVSYFYIIR